VKSAAIIHGHPRLRALLAAAAIVLGLVAVGREVVHGDSTMIIGLFAAGGLVVLAVARRGLFTGVMVLAAMNGLPAIDTSRYVANHVAGQDLACMALIGTAGLWALGRQRRWPPTQLGRRLSLCGALLFGFCVYTVLRTVVDGHASLLGAIRYGRDFLYFGALLIVLPRVRFRREEIDDLLKVMMVGVVLFSIGQIATVEGISNPTWLVHATSTGQTLGLTRLYAPMNDGLFAGVALALATAVLAGRGTLTRRLGIPATLLLGTSLALQLTRARWIALILSLVVVSLFFALQADRRVATVLRRRLVASLLILTALVLVLTFVAPGLISAGPLVRRLLSIFNSTTSNAQTNTLAVRQQVAGLMLQTLGGHWVLGLGLIPPSAHYFLAFPSGSIRDPDVGVLNALMTIGAIGAILIYLPIVVTVLHCMRRVRTRGRVAYSWLNYGGQIFLVAALASSITLVTLFSVAGLMLTGTLLALLAQPSVSGPDVPAAPEADDALVQRLENWPVLEHAPL